MICSWWHLGFPDPAVWCQTVHACRLEYSSPSQRRPNVLDERVLPDLKASIRSADAEAKARTRFRSPVAPRHQDPRRQSRSNGLRNFWHTVWRNGEPARSGPSSPMAADLPVCFPPTPRHTPGDP